MRTKHLLMTTAFASLFAACSSDEFLEKSEMPSTTPVERPMVDVVLNMEEDEAATRLGFNGKYVWKQGDVIRALLMDELLGSRPSGAGWESMAWTQRYQLVDYIHTNYPFTRQANGSWTTDAKMQEGNYFFVFPYPTNEGDREAIHSLEGQVQNGVSAESRKDAYAKNQFFVGYSRVYAGGTEGDVMNANLQMTPILGAVRVDIKNVTQEPMTVKKIVLTSDAFNTLIKVDPTKAQYLGEDGTGDSYNLDNNILAGTPAWQNVSGKSYFSYANYEEMENKNGTWEYNELFAERYTTGGMLINNTKKSVDYNRDAALRAVITTGLTGDNKRAELIVNNAPEIRNGEMQSFIVMTNAYDREATAKGTTPETYDEIYANVYTDRGIIKNVKISGVNGELKTGETTVISDNPILEISPMNGNNIVTLEVDNNSVIAVDAMDIYNESDLAQFVTWNKGKNRPFVATLKNNVTLTKKITNYLTAEDWKNVKLVIEAGTHKVTIAEDAATNILDYVLINGAVEVKNKLVVGEKSFLNGAYQPVAGGSSFTLDQTLTVAKKEKDNVPSLTVSGAVGTLKVVNNSILTINKAVQALTVTNNATMTIAATVRVAANSYNYGVVTVDAAGLLRGATFFTNNSILNNNGEIYNVNNGAGGLITVGSASTVVTNLETRDALSQIDITKNINTNISGNATSGGEILYTLSAANQPTGGLTMKTINDKKITILTVENAKVVANSTGTTASAVHTIYANGATFEGSNSYRGDFGAEVVVNGNFTITYFSINKVYINKGETDVTEVVNTEEIYLGSYNGQTYRAETATLIVNSGATLNAKSIEKNTNPNVKKANAVVLNRSTIDIDQYTEVVNNALANISWEGNTAVDNGKTPVDDPTEATDAQKAAYKAALDKFVQFYITNSPHYKEAVEAGNYGVDDVCVSWIKTSYDAWAANQETKDLKAAANNTSGTHVINMFVNGYPFTKSDLEKSFGRIENIAANLTALKTKLSATNFGKISQAFVPVTVGTTTTSAVTQIVALFKKEVLSNGAFTNGGASEQLLTGSSLGLAYDVLMAVNKLTDAEILAYLSKENSKSVVYKGDNVSKLLKVWVDNGGITADEMSSSYSTFNDGKGSDDGENMYYWAKKILNSESPAQTIAAAKAELVAAGFTNVNSIEFAKGYTKAQLVSLSATF